MPLFIDTAEVARRLDLTPAAFLRCRATLEDLHGFPPPLDGFARPLKWRDTAITAWLASFHAGLTAPQAAAAAAEAPSLRLVQAARHAH